MGAASGNRRIIKDQLAKSYVLPRNLMEPYWSAIVLRQRLGAGAATGKQYSIGPEVSRYSKGNQQSKLYRWYCGGSNILSGFEEDPEGKAGEAVQNLLMVWQNPARFIPGKDNFHP